MNKNTAIAAKIANTTDITVHPKYDGTPFASLADSSVNTKGKVIEAIAWNILESDGHDIFEADNAQHDMRVRFANENHRTKVEVKGCMLKRDSYTMSTGQFQLAADFDELLIVMVFPDEVKGYRVNRSVLRGMDKNGVLNNSKGAKMIGNISDTLLESYDCPRVF